MSKINIFLKKKINIIKHEKTPINKMVEGCWGKRIIIFISKKQYTILQHEYKTHKKSLRIIYI